MVAGWIYTCQYRDMSIQEEDLVNASAPLKDAMTHEIEGALA